MADPYADLAERFVSHYDTLRGVVRQTLLFRQMGAHLPRPPATVADVGGGAGHQAIPLARRGYSVTLIDPSEAMITRASQALEREPKDVQERVALLTMSGEEAGSRLDEKFDAVVCHAVLPYIDDPGPLIDALAKLLKPGGVLSLLAKNADALAMRAGLEGRFDDALQALDARADVGGMGVSTRAHSVDELSTALAARSIRLIEWYGIRVFTDHLGAQPPGEDLESVLLAEETAGSRDPYRQVARLIHLLGRKS